MADVETPKNESRKQLILAASKLLGALALLATAGAGYLQLNGERRALEDREDLVYTALVEKVNELGEQVAYLQGRIDSMHPRKHARPRPAAPLPRPTKPAMDETRDALEPSPEEAGEAPLEAHMEKIEAFRALPSTVQELVESRKQSQIFE